MVRSAPGWRNADASGSVADNMAALRATGAALPTLDWNLPERGFYLRPRWATTPEDRALSGTPVRGTAGTVADSGSADPGS